MNRSFEAEVGVAGVRRQASWTIKFLLAALLLLIFGAGISYYFLAIRIPGLGDNEYHAVLLDNGAAYFGRIIGNSRDYVVMKDVYYVQSHTNPETKEMSNVLVKRGQEWHAPDRMIINRQHLVIVEPVTANSTVARLISQLKPH